MLQTASQRAYFSAKFCKLLRRSHTFLNDSAKYKESLERGEDQANFDSYLRFAAFPAEFCENRGEK